MKNRGIVIIYKDFSSFWLNLLKKADIHVIGLHSIYQYGGVQSYLDWWQKKETQEIILQYEKEGFEFVHQLHAIDYLLPRTLFDTHPNWFRVNENGKRINDWNLCVCNLDALTYIEHSSFELAKKLKQKGHYYHIWSDDCINSTCFCEKCQHISPADQNMIIANHVLKGLKKYDAKAKLSYLSYQDSLGIPTMKPNSDLFLEFAPIDRNHFEAINGNNPENIKNRKILETLIPLFHNQVQILEYYLDASYFCKWKREEVSDLIFKENIIEQDMQYYKEIGADMIMTFAGFIDQSWIDHYGDQKIIQYGQIAKKFFS